METINEIFGLKTQELISYQMVARAVVVFFSALIFVRVAGLRTLGKYNAFDHITVLILGSIMGRSVVAAGPFFSFLLGVAVIILLHRLMAWSSYKSHKIGKILKGNPLILYKKGQLQQHNMKRTLVTIEDLEETIRVLMKEDGFDHVEEIRLERSGRISVVKKK